MKVVFLLFDSLNKRALQCYGGSNIRTPNFSRFGERAVRFNNHYVGSMPCMPARRDMHTGRLNFLHRSWGPLEPYDRSAIAILRDRGVHSHLVSDHLHYFYEGGGTYHTQYSSWEFIRGQEADRWKAMVQPPLERFREMYHDNQYDLQDDRYLPYMMNREFIREESDFPLVKCIAAGLDFLDRNHDRDDWILQIECFDPHEPFYAPPRFRQEYPSGYQGPILDWPRYDRLSEDAHEIEELRANYAALTTMCDEYLGKVLDFFDERDLWSDTVLIATTDHGFLLGEHDWWAKNKMPFYNEIANIPLLVYHPAYADRGGEARGALTQTMDVMPTLLDLFETAIPDTAEGLSLIPAVAESADRHEGLLYGMFGGAVNVTDGRYTYFRYPENIFEQDIYEYTLMPMHQRSFFGHNELAGLELAEPFGFTDGLKLMKMPARKAADGRVDVHGLHEDTTTVLYDLETDPGQLSPIDAPEIIGRLEGLMLELMRRNEAPPEAFSRIGLDPHL
ncbi:sulfatase [Bauldia sp.]|uniref:sulfatase n=1 Tax=Bauldia sp. TaxID=2575872 RepID=UPI003BAB0EAE